MSITILQHCLYQMMCKCKLTLTWQLIDVAFWCILWKHLITCHKAIHDNIFHIINKTCHNELSNVVNMKSQNVCQVDVKKHAEGWKKLSKKFFHPLFIHFSLDTSQKTFHCSEKNFEICGKQNIRNRLTLFCIQDVKREFMSAVTLRFFPAFRHFLQINQ